MGTSADISDLEKAIRLTHPEFSGKIEEEDLFSIQELNLLLFLCKVQDTKGSGARKRIVGSASSIHSGAYNRYSGKKSDFSASGVSILSVCDWRGKCTETVFVVQRSI